MMKVIYNKQKKSIININNIVDIRISNNYIIATAIDGREIRVFYGTESQLNKIMEDIVLFLEDDRKVFEV